MIIINDNFVLINWIHIKKKIVLQYYFLHKTQKELSKKYNINRNTISSLFKKK